MRPSLPGSYRANFVVYELRASSAYVDRLGFVGAVELTKLVAAHRPPQFAHFGGLKALFLYPSRVGQVKVLALEHVPHRFQQNAVVPHCGYEHSVGAPTENVLK